MMRRVGLLLLFAWLLLIGCTGRGNSPAAIPESDLLYTDQFTPGETGRWRIEGDTASSSLLSNGRLNIAVNQAETVHYATLDSEIFTDFLLTIETTLVSGNPENSLGVLFRMEDAGRFYRFEITGNGLFMVERRDGETRSSLTQGWLESTDLVQGVGAVNRLQIQAVGDLFTFSINDVVVSEITDGTIARGTIALDAGAFARPGIEAAFDNLLIARP